MNDTPSPPSEKRGISRFLPSRGCLFTLLGLLLLVALSPAFLKYLIWKEEKWAEGVPRGSWVAVGMPKILSGFPAYEPTGDVIQHFWPDDGKPRESRVYYYTQMDLQTLVDHYKDYLAKIGCSYELESDGDSSSFLFNVDCPTRSGMFMRVSDMKKRRRVNAFWREGEW